MPRDHYLPASVIGRFSDDDVTTSARERRVCVLRKGRRRPFLAKAANIGYENNLYRVSASPWGGTPNSVDPELHGYESGLPDALNLLEQAAPIELSVWLRTLVPYVAATFVRGADFILRYMNRPSVAAAGTLNTIENANGARGIEFERLLAPVCCARWIVLHKDSGEPFVLNDLGLTGTFDKSTGAHGWATPIGKNTVLGIFPTERGPVAAYQDGIWNAIIEYRRLDAQEARGMNDSMAHLATSFVLGPDPTALMRLAPIVADRGEASALMDAWPIEYKKRLAHAREWHRLVTVAVNNPSPGDLNDLQPVDPKALAMGWCPPVGIILNMREFPTGLTRADNVIYLNLDTPIDYQGYFIRSPAK